MPDQMDRAAEISETWRQDAIEAARPRGAGSLECSDCGEEISPKRRQALPSATRCLACQSRQEARRK
ncbi:TraR/DksA C4-type zinc finger protein [Roseococcus sp. SDR]|uniref:TraR/DksA C4-type zinc finger protein n=1 Tax=Roseococcus sp. SDR TaxID=2835532 RepID=UPI001BCF6637|nr:TraR/DksA C4-type zinc finger protein [Roseococcus sp. SDR]MBS7792196.1 TraR/DksA C4-type zinc finger protein [Roseococcus sp. SDR]MBV1847510.1 TraR/DksA C4-type zinc finger protein [Roseococcus sp. SDR]